MSTNNTTKTTGVSDFIASLMENDNDVVYSKEPEKPTTIIPPEISITAPDLDSTANDSGSKKQLPRININTQSSNNITTDSKNNDTTTQHAKYKFNIKIKKDTDDVDNIQQEHKDSSSTNITTNISKKPSQDEVIEALFRASGTPLNKRELWYQYYNKAKSSSARNSVAVRMKEGKFAISPNNDVIVLPNYSGIRKSTTEILQDKWIK